MDRIGFALILLFSQMASGAEFFAVPGGARLEGVGGIYGVAAGAKKLVGERMTLLAGASFGQVEAQGALVTDIPIGLERTGLMLGFANLTRARFNTAYARGVNSAPVFEQEISGQAFGGGLEVKGLGERLKFSIGLIQSTLNLDDYYLGESKVERPNKGGYHAIETSSYFLTTKFDSEADDAKSGWNAGVSAATADGRLAQSDTLTATYSLGARLALAPRWTLAGRLGWSDAYVTRQETKYLTAAQAQTALNTGCGTLADPNEQAKCQALEDSLSGYIAENNLNGTAAPLGGSGGVQAFDELSLRSAHTRLVSLELRMKVLEWLQVVPAYQLGWSADSSDDLYDRSVHSYGAGLRFKTKALAARLAYAQTHDQSAWFLTIER